MDFDTWEQLDFPVPASQRTGEVYVLFYASGQIEIPFYVGQTVRFMERMGDYEGAQFAASTDFKVGIAIKFFTSLDFRVFARHKKSQDRRLEERDIIKRLGKEGFTLLNSLGGYNYTKSEAAHELEKVHEFCRLHLQK